MTARAGFVVDRKFLAANGRQVGFEAIFGAGGVWTKLLHEARGYLGTEVCCEVPAARQVSGENFWEWHRSFEDFRSRFKSEYEDFINGIFSDGLIEKEQFLGAYYEKHPGDDDELVPS